MKASRNVLSDAGSRLLFLVDGSGSPSTGTTTQDVIVSLSSSVPRSMGSDDHIALVSVLHPLDGGDDVVRCVPLYRDLRVGCARQRCVAGGLLPSTPQWRTMTAAQSNASRIASAARMYAAMSSVLAGRQSQVVDGS